MTEAGTDDALLVHGAPLFFFVWVRPNRKWGIEWSSVWRGDEGGRGVEVAGARKGLCGFGLWEKFGVLVNGSGIAGMGLDGFG